MNWKKKGLIFNSDKTFDWAVTGAMIPTPIILNDEIIRVFVTFLDKLGIGRTGYVDLCKDNPFKILDISKKPIFNIGGSGAFDDNGVLTCSVLQNKKNEFLFYYAGFELGQKIRYRLLSGLAITDNKFNLIKKFNVPILERSENELFFRGGPFCIFDEKKSIYKMWYVGGSEWKVINSKPMPIYFIKYIESIDGIDWPNEGKTCFGFASRDEYGFGRPYVIYHENIYKMFYSIRLISKGYRLGYAESVDGYNWTRKDHMMDLDISPDGWDSEMLTYASVINNEGRLMMFYNGNQYGKTGFGLAEFVSN